MGFGSWITRAIDTITPWDRGGEVERRKKREEEQQQRQNVNQTRQQFNAPITRQPNNPITDIIQQREKKPINIGLEPQNQVQVPQKSEYDNVLPKPKQSFWNKVRDQFDANTEADKYRRLERDSANIRNDLLSRGVEPNKATETSVKIAKSTAQPYHGGIDTLRDYNVGLMAGGAKMAVDTVKGIGRGAKFAATNPIESGREELAKLTNNKEAERAAKYRQLKNAFGGETLKDGELGYGDLFEAGSNVLSVLPVLKGVGMAETATRQALTQGGKQGAVTATKGVLSGVDEALFNLRDFRNIFRKPNIAKEIQGAEKNLAEGGVLSTLPREIDDLLSEAAIRDLVKTDIPVTQEGHAIGEAIDVRNLSEPKPLIREVGGDATNATTNIVDKANDIRRAQREAEAAITTPNTATARASSGLIDNPKYLGEAGGVTKIEIDTERAMLDEALANKEINKTQYKEANKALDETVASDAPAPTDGRKIEVQQPRDIPVVDETIVPQGLPEKPGTVRATAVTDKQAIKTQMAAEQPIVAPPATIPKETQHILDNPKQYNKRQVEAARNQRKLAKAYAKDQEETSEQYTRAVNAIEDRTPSFEGKNEGFAPTGEFKKGKRGNIYEVSKGEAEKSRASVVAGTESAEEIYSNAVKRRATQGAYSPRDVGAVKELVESGQVTPDNPLYRKLLDVGKESGTDWGKTGSLMTKTKRGSDSGAKLTSAFARKIWNMAEDTTKVDTVDFKAVENANNVFAEARDKANELFNTYKKSGSDADFDAFIKAQDAVDKADIAAKRTEYQTAKGLLKDNVQVEKMRQLERLASEGDLGKMDYVDSAMLSSAGTMLRNLVNSVPSMIEEGIFGKGAAKITNKFRPDTEIGGGLSKSTLSSLKRGLSDFGDKAKAMKQDSGSIFRHPIENLKTFSTLGNETGDVVIDATARESLKDAYKNTLKSEGFTGDIEKMAEAMSRNDPQRLLHEYQRIARIDAGLGGGNITKRTKLELNIAESISNVLGTGNPTAKTDAFAKALTRVTIGFPGAVARATGTGLKRLPGGSLYDFAAAARATDNTQKALLTKQAIKQTGTGLTVLPGLFYTLGATGHLSGSYPTDPDERARWEREGISENSIKIGDDWYQFPAFLGAWSAPATFWGAIGRGENVKDASITTAKGVSDVLPTDQLSKLSDVIKGRSSGEKFVPNFTANVTRALTPAGALLNQVAKVFDSTENDTNSGSMLDDFVDKVFGGIPGGDKIVDIPDKLTDQGEVIKNPDPLAVMVGASSTEQSKGIEQSKNIQSNIDNQLSQIDQYGLLNDSNLDGVLTDSGLQAYNKTKGGKKLDESDIKALREGLVKGVSPTKDTAYLEREQYDTNLNVLKLKRDLISSDKTVAPSTIEELDTQIRRAEMYKDGKINYKDVDEYKNVTLSEWRKMGDPDSDEYNPEMYQKLWEIDQVMAKNDASYAKGDTSKQKYSAKKSGSGSGRGRGGSRLTKLSADFGRLTGSSPFAPKIREYQTMEQATNKIPVIRRVQPNIVHTIRSGRV